MFISLSQSCRTTMLPFGQGLHQGMQWKTEASSASQRLQVARPTQPVPIRHFFKVDDYFYRGEQPGLPQPHQPGLNIYPQTISPEKLEEALLFLRDKCGIKTIVNLRDRYQHKDRVDDSFIKLEQDTINKLNQKAPPDKQMRFVSIELHWNTAIADEQVQPLIALIRDRQQHPLFVHCYAGRDRTGLFAALYRIIHNKAGFHCIHSEMKHCGHDPSNTWVSGYTNNLRNILKKTPFFRQYYQQNEAAIEETVKRLKPASSESR